MTDICKCRKALYQLINGKFSLHIPPEKDDPDFLLSDALDALEKAEARVKELEGKVVNQGLQQMLDINRYVASISMLCDEKGKAEAENEKLRAALKQILELELEKSCESECLAIAEEALEEGE